MLIRLIYSYRFCNSKAVSNHLNPQLSTYDINLEMQYYQSHIIEKINAEDTHARFENPYQNKRRSCAVYNKQQLCIFV